MGAADLDDRRECLGLGVERGLQMLQRRNEPLGDLLRRRDMHRGREAVVGRLAHVDMIVGMDRRFRTELAAEPFVGAVGDHLVHVHVGLGAGSGLPDDQRKLLVEFAVDDFLRGLDDRFSAPRIERSKLAIGLRRRAFDDRQRPDKRARHAFFADTEIIAGAFGLRAPIAFGRDFDRSEAVGFGAGFHRHAYSEAARTVLEGCTATFS